MQIRKLALGLFVISLHKYIDRVWLKNHLVETPQVIIYFIFTGVNRLQFIRTMARQPSLYVVQKIGSFRYALKVFSLPYLFWFISNLLYICGFNTKVWCYSYLSLLMAFYWQDEAALLFYGVYLNFIMSTLKSINWLLEVKESP